MKSRGLSSKSGAKLSSGAKPEETRPSDSANPVAASTEAAALDQIEVIPSAGMLQEPPTDTNTIGPVRGRGGVGARLVAHDGIKLGLGSSRQSLDTALDLLWKRRSDVAMQPNPGAALRILAGNEPERPLSVQPDRYLRGLLAVASQRAPGAPTHSKQMKTFDKLRTSIRQAVRGEVSWSCRARDTFYFDRPDCDAGQAKQVVFVNARHDHMPALVDELVKKVLDKPASFPGIRRIKVAGPYKSGRADNIVINADSEQDAERVVELIAQIQKTAPEWFNSQVPPLTEPQLPGVSIGDAPAATRYAGQSFPSIRSQVLHSVTCEAAARGLDEAAFRELFDARWEEAGFQIDAPHRHSEAVGVHDTTPVALPGSQKVTAGVTHVDVRGFGGEREFPVEIEIAKEVGQRLGRRKGVRFVPEQGLFVKVDVDATRGPPRERIVRQFAASMVDDSRYRLQFGEMAPPFVHFDSETQTYHIPKKVTYGPAPAGVYGNYTIDVELDPTRPGRKVPPRLKLIRQLNDRSVTGAELRTVMQKIDGFVSDPDAAIAGRVVLEEGTNGVSVVSLTNKAVGVWKPTAAEYPEQLRVNLEPDHQARREAFAYWLSKNLGHLGRVPPTRYREFDGEAGVISALSRGTLPGSHSPLLDEVLADPKGERYQEIAVLDCIIGNLDRHSGNILFGSNAMLAIDHGLAFPTQHGEQGEMNYLFGESVALTPAQYEAIEALLARKGEVRAQAEELEIDPRAVDLMFERMEHMLLAGRTYSEWRTEPETEAG